MKKFVLFSILILIAISIAVSGCQKTQEAILEIGGGLSTPQYAQTPVKVYSMPLPVFEPFQYAWFYKPPARNADLGAVAANFDLLILTRNDEREREEMRSMGNSSPILQYLRFEAVMDPGNCSTKPQQNQVAHLEGDFCLLAEQHPDWFLQDINGRAINYENSGYVFMDPGNLQWQAYFMDKIKGFQNDAGWSGVFLDNVDGSLGRFEDMHLLLANYADDTAYQTAVVTFLKNLYTGYFSPSHKLLFANIPYLKDDTVWFTYLQYLDGAMLEAFAADWQNGYLSENEWLNQLYLAEKTQMLEKSIILVTQGDVNDQQRMQFGLASFLLVNNGRAYFRYSNDQAYRDLWWYPQFDIDLGQPLGSRYPENKIWRRDFEKGTVLVDPQKHTAEIKVY